MSIGTYAELRSAIADWLARPDDPTIAAVAPDLIRLCESRINHGSGEPGDPLYSPPLRTRAMETRTAMASAGAYVALPADFLELRAIEVNGVPLGYMTPQNFMDSAGMQQAGVPRFYTIIGRELRLGPAPTVEKPLTVELFYYAKVPALSDENPTNWLLEASPSAYLYGALVGAAPYIGDDQRMALWFSLFAAALKGLQGTERRATHGGAPLVMRSGVRTP